MKKKTITEYKIEIKLDGMWIHLPYKFDQLFYAQDYIREKPKDKYRIKKTTTTDEVVE